MDDKWQPWIETSVVVAGIHIQKKKKLIAKSFLCSLFFFSLLKRIQLLNEKNAPVREDPVLEGFLCLRKQTGNHKSNFPL